MISTFKSCYFYLLVKADEVWICQLFLSVIVCCCVVVDNCVLVEYMLFYMYLFVCVSEHVGVRVHTIEE